MKLAKEEKDKKEEKVEKTIVVGVKIGDEDSTKILTWALLNIAKPGDQVIALNILPSSSKSGPDGKSSSSSIAKGLESILAAYGGFCNLRQIDLKLKVCKGSSMRRILVKEMHSLGATQLILGATKTNPTIGPSPTSVAKYCAKKLPKSCSVVAVNNGKIVFQNEALENNKMNHSNSITRSDCDIIESNDNPLSLDMFSSEKNCSICCTPSTPQKSHKTKEPIESAEAPSSTSDSPETPKSADIRAGWRLLSKSVLTHEKRKLSVIQWAMRLPSRCTASSVVHPDHKHTKSNSTDISSINGENDPCSPFVASHDGESKLTKDLESLQKKYSSISQSFSYKELMDATSNFSLDNLIGKGGSSRVYKGCSVDGKQLAVKILKLSEDATREFVAEIEILTTLDHKNIVSLCGFCSEKDHLILVYDFLPKGSLEENLHGDKENKSVISWAERYKVAIGVAQALDYLHDSRRTEPVIHKDVKSSNILLSDDFVPQLSDFGLATWASASQSSSACKDVTGTFGYLAPEYFIYGRVNEKIDIYAFGVVLLELLSGRKPISIEDGQKSLVMWAKPILHGGKFKQLMDPCLSNEYDDDQLERMILAASLCIRRSPRSRPKIVQVLKLLEGDDEAVKWAKSKVSALEEIDELDDEFEFVAYPDSNLRSHLNIALLDIEDDSTSVSSTEQYVDLLASNSSLDDYFQGTWSRMSIFN